MSTAAAPESPAERRKQVRLKVRPDLQHVEQRYEGKRFFVIKDPVCLRYYRFNQQEYFVFSLFDGGHSMEDVRKRFEDEFRPHRLEFQDLEGFARQLVTAGLVQHEQAGTGAHLFRRRAKQRGMQKLATFTNILYLKIPVFDPDRLLAWMYTWLWWIFTRPFFYASVGLMVAALCQVTLHFQTFYDKLPAYKEFFAYQTVLYMWLSLGVVKVIHEFGHGLSCKAFKGECHEMGILLMCLSPALYANVTDAWTVADKWKRIVISFAGIYVELIIASLATFVWWYTPHVPVVNNVAMCIMVLCSVSTVVFNANPLMRFDGYYILADWLEVPNLRDRANQFLNNLFLRVGLGVETPPEPYMAPGRKLLFAAYAVGSYVYRWVVTFGVLWFLSGFLDPKLKVLSRMLAYASLASMLVWPAYKMAKNVYQRGRLPDMKMNRVYITAGVLLALVLAFCFLPLPISRVRDMGLVAADPAFATPVGPKETGRLEEVLVAEGQAVRQGERIARFAAAEVDEKVREARTDLQEAETRLNRLREEDARTGNRDATGRLKDAVSQAASDAGVRKNRLAQLEKLQAEQQEVYAPVSGVALGVPRSTDLGKVYDRNFQEAKPVLTIADPTRLVVRLPVSAMNHRLLKEDLPPGGELAAEVYVPGRTDRSYKARIRRLPEADEKKLPPQLTQRGGGPWAVRQAGEKGEETVPVSPVYLVDVELLDPDASALPGTQVQVKVYCKWRSGGWWAMRKLAEALDLGLYK